MRDRQKGWQSDNRTSVIGRLMCLDKQLSPQPLNEKGRVLSDSYFHKAATVCIRPGSLVSTKRLRRTKKEIVHGVEGVSEVEILEVEHDTDLHKCIDSTTSEVKRGVRIPKCSGALVRKRSLSKNREQYTQGDFLRYVRKLKHDSVADHLGEPGIDYMNRSSKFQLDRIVKPYPFSSSICAFKRKPEKVIYGFQDLKLGMHSKSGCREHKQCLRPHHELTLVVEDTVSSRRHCNGRIQHMNQISRQAPGKSKFAEVSRPEHMGDDYLVNKEDVESSHASHLSPNCSSFLYESKKQKIQRWTAGKEAQRVGFLGKCPTIDKTLALANKESMPGKIKEALSGSWNLQQDESTYRENKFEEKPLSHKDIFETIRGRGCDEIGTASDSTGVCSRINGDLKSKPHPGILSGEGGHAFYVHEGFGGESSLNEFSEEESAYWNSYRVGPPEFHHNLKRTSQHSPGSILEPFYVQNSSAFECFDGIDLWLQPLAINLKTEETYSEVSVMGVSGDEDSKKQFGDLSHNGRRVKRWIEDDESRNLSYMVNVLDEARFCGMKSFMDFKTWHSLECPISPLVFEALEIKYGKETSWPKPERQLLFDCINSGLVSMFNPLLNFHMSIKRTLRANMRRDLVEDELWTMLISKGREKSKYLSESSLEQWLEAEEGMDIICRELATYLFDELVMGLASW